MRRVEIPVVRLEAVVRILGCPTQSHDRAALDPIVAKIRTARDEAGVVTVLLTDEECIAAQTAVAAFGGIEGKLSLIFADAPVDDPTTTWRR